LKQEVSAFKMWKQAFLWREGIFAAFSLGSSSLLSMICSYRSRRECVTAPHICRRLREGVQILSFREFMWSPVLGGTGRSDPSMFA